MKLFFRYVHYRRRTVIVFVVFSAVFAAAFRLYGVPMAVIAYPLALCAVIGLVILAVSFISEMKKYNKLRAVQNLTSELVDTLPPAHTIAEEEYKTIIAALCREAERIKTDDAVKYSETVDYYTLWAHEIKTPIASMLITLQNEDTPLSRRLRADLGRIDSYVDMVLAFVRLESDSTDYVFAEYELDSLLRPVIKKLAPDFIGKKLTLKCGDTDVKVLTDEKWLAFVLEQILSNAVKYTFEGGVSVYAEGKTLVIGDTGIGIAPEDLPRVFENGYTGFNGRSHKRASGIGLYLTKRVCDNLGIEISLSSEPGVGTSVRLIFPERTDFTE